MRLFRASALSPIVDTFAGEVSPRGDDKLYEMHPLKKPATGFPTRALKSCDDVICARDLPDMSNSFGEALYYSASSEYGVVATWASSAFSSATIFGLRSQT